VCRTATDVQRQGINNVENADELEGDDHAYWQSCPSID
jgi:hypothetical protein